MKKMSLDVFLKMAKDSKLKLLELREADHSNMNLSTNTTVKFWKNEI